MASSRQGDWSGPEIPETPDFSNLEVRGVWTGNPNDPVDLRISLEVDCVPNTELRLLNTRSPGMFFIKTFSVRLQSDDWGRGNQSRHGPPRSPLFSFPSVLSDGEKDASTLAESTSRESYSQDLESLSGSQTDWNRPVRGSTEELTDNEDGQSVTHNRFSPVPNFQSGSSFNVDRNNGWGYLQRKRSATVACLSDSESESEKEKTDQSSAAAMESTAKTSPAGSAPGSDVPAGIIGLESGKKTVHRNKLSRPTIPAPWRPCLIPKRVTQSKETGSSSSADVFTSSLSVTQPDAGYPTHSQQPISEYAPSEEDKDKASNLSTTPATTDKAKKGATKKLSFVQKVAELVKKAKENSVESDEFFEQKTANGQLIPLDSDDESEATEASPTDDSTPATAVRYPSFTASPEGAPASEGCRRSNWLGYSSEHESTCECEDCQTLTDDPELVLEDGILFIKNPDNVREATYKFAVTVSATLTNDGPREWFDLVIPGLPELKGDSCGYFLFQIPENLGLDFRTTNLQRYKMVENCFFAEFTDSANLVVPISVCDPKFYGVVRDFTLDQEIRADHVITRAPGERYLYLKYNAICSLRLHNRCFWSEKCCFFLYLEGGPEGYFRGQFEPQSPGLQMIRLETRERGPIGVSHVKVICSPRDLEMFCLTWEVCIPGSQAVNWLPRIYPVTSTTSESHRQHLRRKFTELETRLLVDEKYADDTSEDTEAEDQTGDDESTKKQSNMPDRFSEFDDIIAGCLYFVVSHLSEVPSKFSAVMVAGARWKKIFEVSKANRARGLMIYRRRGVLAVLCMGFIMLFALLSIESHNASVSLQNCLQRDTEMTAPTASTEYSGPGESDTSRAEKPLDFWCDIFAPAVFKITKSKKNESVFSTELNVDTPTDLEGGGIEESNGFDGPNANDKTTDAGMSEKEDMASDEDMESTVASSNTDMDMRPLGLSLRDRIDYFLGWSGPVYRTDYRTDGDEDAQGQ